MKQCYFFRKFSIFICILSIFQIIYAQKKDRQPPFVKNIQALPVNSNTIELTWNIPEQINGMTITSFSIYRSNFPIISTTGLESLQPVLKVTGTFMACRDTVPDDADYYYAIIINATEHIDRQEENSGNLYFDEELDIISNDNSTSCMIIVPGENATVAGTHVTNFSPENLQKIYRTKNKNQVPKRNIPVPYMNPVANEQEFSKAEKINNEHKISQQTEEYAVKLIKNNKNDSNVPLEKHIFSEDFITSGREDDYQFFEILSECFFKENYEEAIIRFNTFLSKNKNKITTEKALFYLGESYYFTGNYKKAVQAFLKVYNAYPNLAGKWIDSSLDLLND